MEQVKATIRGCGKKERCDEDMGWHGRGGREQTGGWGTTSWGTRRWGTTVEMYLISNFSDFQLSCIGSFILHESVFFLSGLPFILLERLGYLSKYKIQAKVNTPEAQGKCITRLLLYHFCVNLPVMLLSYPVFRSMGMRSSLPLPSWYATPFGLTSEYAHPAEILFLGFATIVGPAVTGPHLFTLWLWMVVRVLETVEAHCGYHFPWSPSNFLPLYGG
ncbi:hypothetical protein KSS87_012741 [Heliosperma pusillum]|nr:hypothetical protein KSS87_012741 [Heliosperma pusillum]